MRAMKTPKSWAFKRCSFLSPKLKNDLVSVCEYLGMTQREFLESMLSDAVSKAWELVQQEEATPEALGYVKAD